MGYLHIDNLYKDQRVMEFRHVYAMEKIHGTSAHIAWKHGNELRFFSGGEKHERFVALFDGMGLLAKFRDKFGADPVTVYGEAYGGKQQGMRETYGDDLRFVVFDVRIGESWLDVPKAENVAEYLGLEFVHYELVSSAIENLDAERDADSVQAIRNGVGPGKKREGIVIRPPFEVRLNNGARVIAKHKRDDFRETKTPRKVGTDPKVLRNAQLVADEWVTAMRLDHVLDKLPHATGMEHTGDVVRAMVEDVLREGEGEIVVSAAVKKAISAATAQAWKRRVKARAFGSGQVVAVDGGRGI